MYAGALDKTVEERIMASLYHEEGDRVPIWDYLDNTGIIRYFEQEGDDYTTAMVRVYHGLGIDLCRGYLSSSSATTSPTRIGSSIPSSSCGRRSSPASPA